MGDKVAELLENEWYIVRNSGETPEIALHSALYYLTLSHDGPQLALTEEQVAWLRQAAVDRFYEIIVRDLQHANHGTPSYRGITRSIINYRRFCTFCQRQQLSRSLLRQPTAAALLNFLEIEAVEVKRQRRPSIIDCSGEALRTFATDLGVACSARFGEFIELCPKVE